MTTDDCMMEDSQHSGDSNSSASDIPKVISRVFWLITGVIIQIAAMIVVTYNPETGSGLGGPLWQTGSLRVYADLLMSRQCVIYFFPLITGSMIGLVAYCRWPRLSAWWMGLLLLSGLLLHIQFAVLLILASDNYIVYGPLTAIITSAIIAQLLRFIAAVKRFNIAWLWGLTTIAALVVVALAQFFGDGLDSAHDFTSIIPLLFGLGALSAAPCLGVCSFAMAYRCFLDQRSKAISSLEKSRFPRIAWLAMLAWVTGYFVAWKYAIEMMLKLYSSLPATKPSCYICTAAANGHPRFASSRLNSAGFRFNYQMQYLKVFEFAIATCSPHLHRWLRIVYNRFGPRAAQVVASNRWLADLVYLSWLPAELIARVLVWLLRIDRKLIAKLYG